MSGPVESANPVAPAVSANSILMKECEHLLRRLMTHEFGWIFNCPVDPVLLELPDYFDIIDHPMDLGTVKSKLASGAYSCPLDFAADVRLTFTNALTYNPPENEVHAMAETLSSCFEQRWKPIEDLHVVTKNLRLLNDAGAS